VQLSKLIGVRRWSRRAVFPPSTALTERLFAVGHGLYLITNPRRGDGDPVLSVGWAESDYWARRAWENPPFRGDLTVPPPQWRPAPSLVFLARPASLAFGTICDFEQRQPGARIATLVTGVYRLTDGAFLHCRVSGLYGVSYFYESNDPRPGDEPSAIEFRLPEVGSSTTCIEVPDG